MKIGEVPLCEICGRAMTKIIVDFEDDGSVMTAYECDEHQTLSELSTESVESLESQGVRALSLVEEVAAMPDGTICLPLSEQVATRTKLRPGSKVRVMMTDDDHVVLKVA